MHRAILLCFTVELESQLNRNLSERIYNWGIASFCIPWWGVVERTESRPEVNCQHPDSTGCPASGSTGQDSLRIHTHPCHERLRTWELLKCIHAHNVEEAQGHSNGCQGLVRLSELRTTFSVSLAAGMFELYNPAGSHSWECHMWALIKCYI